MSLELYSKSFELTDAIKDHAEKAVTKFEKLNISLSKKLTLHKEGKDYVAELEVWCNHGHHFFAKELNADCYQAISNVVPKVYEKVKKFREKQRH